MFYTIFAPSMPNKSVHHSQCLHSTLEKCIRLPYEGKCCKSLTVCKVCVASRVQYFILQLGEHNFETSTKYFQLAYCQLGKFHPKQQHFFTLKIPYCKKTCARITGNEQYIE